MESNIVKSQARINEIASTEKVAPNNERVMGQNLLLSSSSSREPSSTISINPAVPSSGKENSISGIGILKSPAATFSVQPRARSSITEGILVFGEVTSNMYAISNSRQNVIIMVAVILVL